MIIPERWAFIPRFPCYEASDIGRVRQSDSGFVLTLKWSTGGYLRAQMPDAGRDFVHRLVLEAFTGPGEGKMECRHLNGIPWDNRWVNLAWGSHWENMQDSVLHGTRAKGSRNGNSRLIQEQVDMIRFEYAEKDITQRALALKFNVSQRTIWNIVNEEQWRN